MASEDNATEAQIKRLYAVLHSVGLDPKQWKKDQNIAAYSKLTRAQCSAYIDEAEVFEAEQKAEGAQGHIDETEKRQGFGGRAKAEAEKIRQEQGLTVPPAPTPEATVKENLTVPELIHFYIDIIAQVTVGVEQEDRIPAKENGYATNWVGDAVKEAIQKGGNHKEQV